MAIISISDSQVNGADQILVADASSKIPAKDGSQITILNATNVTTGTIASARLDTGTTANKLVVLDGSGNLPAVDASLLTGVVSATISASDPTLSTNPSGGVGTEWNNSTSGEMYICTDATAGENVWTNVGAGSGNIDPWSYPVSTNGYLMNGNVNPATSTVNHIQKFSTVTDGNAADVANLTQACSSPAAGQKSLAYGYAAGGSDPSVPGYSRIDKFPFATNGDATNIGDLTVGRGGVTGHSSGTYCYNAKGHTGSYSNVIDKFSVTTDADSNDVGDIGSYGTAGYSNSSATNGYSSGGYNGSPSSTGVQNHILRISFTTDGNSVDVADLDRTKSGRVSSDSLTHAFFGCGDSNYSMSKMSHASESTATVVGNMVATSIHGTGGAASSLDNGYAASGHVSNAIGKYSHVTDGNATDIADVAVPVNEAGGTHG